jgi:hypothetical protein
VRRAKNRLGLGDCHPVRFGQVGGQFDDEFCALADAITARSDRATVRIAERQAYSQANAETAMLRTAL